jgi:hypothetical protein
VGRGTRSQDVRVTPSLRGRVLAFAVVPVVLLVAAVPAGAAPAVSASEAQSWYQKVVGDLTPLQSSLVNGLNAASGWQRGSQAASSAGRAIRRDLPSLEEARAGVERLQPLAGYAPAKAEYADAIGLYVEAFQLELAATGLPSGPLVTQLQRSFERIRELGDVTFDQGTAALASLLGPSIAGPDVAAAAHVPDWTALGLQPEEPLVSVWEDSAAPPSGTQSAADWSAAVTRLGAPSQTSLRSAVSGRAGPAKLTGLVAATNGAEVALSSVAQPTGDPQASYRLRLGLLVDAESLLAAEASDLSRRDPSRSLAAVAASLVSIGSDLRAGDA